MPRPDPIPPQRTAVIRRFWRIFRLLAEVLRHWLQDPDKSESWRATALEARTRLPGWSSTAREVLVLLAGRD